VKVHAPLPRLCARLPRLAPAGLPPKRPQALTQGHAAPLSGLSRRRVSERVGAQRQRMPDTTLRCGRALRLRAVV
jgi:hypothetical protein